MKKSYSTLIQSVLFFKKGFMRFGFVFLMMMFLNSFKITGQVLWSSAGGSAWLTAANWTGSAIPTGVQIAQFGVNPIAATGVGINMNGATNNGANSQVVGAIEVTSARLVGMIVGNSSTTTNGTLTLNGVTVNAVNNVILQTNSSNPLLIQDVQGAGNRTMAVVLGNVTDNVVNIDGTGGVTISSIISGAGKNLTLSGIGNGILSLTGADTYDGLTTVLSNTLQLNKIGGGTLPATNNVVINGTGTLRISSSQTLNNLTLATGATLLVDNGTLTINGTFNHNGGTVTLTGTGSIAYGAGATLSYGSTILQNTASAEFPATTGPSNLTINNSAGVVLHAGRIVSGALNFTDGNFSLGANDFTTASVTGTPTATNNHVVTDLTGKLVITNVGAAVTVFPIGPSTTKYNPVAISNGQNIDYGARVEIGINPMIAYSNIAVNRTWTIKPTATPGAPVNVNFIYTNTDGNPGFLYGSTVDVGLYTTVWNIIQSGIIQAGGPTTYQVATTSSIFGANLDAPMVIGNLGAILASKTSIDLIAQKQNSKTLLSWVVNGTDVKQLEIERSSNGRNFVSLVVLGSNSNSYNDDKLLGGFNYYRIKITDINGKITYSTIAAVLNKESGFDIVGLSPTLVSSNAVLNVTAAQKTKMNVLVTDIAGKQVQKIAYNLIAGSNQFTLNFAGLSAGTYQITGYTADGASRTVRFVKQ